MLNTSDVISFLSNRPIEVLLLPIGLFFIVVSMYGRIKDWVSANPLERLISGLIGILLILPFLFNYILGISIINYFQTETEINNGIVGHYNFDEKGNIERDISSNKFDGTNMGAENGEGIRNSGASFDGGSKIVIEEFRDFEWKSNFSVSVWFKRTGQWKAYQGIVNNGYFSNGSWEIRMGRENEGRMLGGSIIKSASDTTWDYENIEASQKKWHHVVMTYNGKKLLFYLDGKRQSGNKNKKGDLPSKDTPVTIGQAGIGKDTEFFHGFIDELRIYSRTLSFSEINTLFKLQY